MKFLVAVCFLAVCAASAEVPQEQEGQVREKRGFLSAPIPISYSSSYIHHAPSVAVAYHAPIPAVKVIQPLPVAKVVAPAVTYTKVAYPSILPYYGGYAHGYGHGFGHGYGHGFGYFH